MHSCCAFHTIYQSATWVEWVRQSGSTFVAGRGAQTRLQSLNSSYRLTQISSSNFNAYDIPDVPVALLVPLPALVPRVFAAELAEPEPTFLEAELAPALLVPEPVLVEADNDLLHFHSKIATVGIKEIALRLWTWTWTLFPGSWKLSPCLRRRVASSWIEVQRIQN